MVIPMNDDDLSELLSGKITSTYDYFVAKLRAVDLSKIFTVVKQYLAQDVGAAAEEGSEAVSMLAASFAFEFKTAAVEAAEESTCIASSDAFALVAAILCSSVFMVLSVGSGFDMINCNLNSTILVCFFIFFLRLPNQKINRNRE